MPTAQLVPNRPGLVAPLWLSAAEVAAIVGGGATAADIERQVDEYLVRSRSRGRYTAGWMSAGGGERRAMRHVFGQALGLSPSSWVRAVDTWMLAQQA